MNRKKCVYFDNDPYNSQLKRYSKACGSYHEFRDWLLLIRNRLNHGFLLVATLNSSRKGGYFCNGGRAFICVLLFSIQLFSCFFQQITCTVSFTCKCWSSNDICIKLAPYQQNEYCEFMVRPVSPYKPSPKNSYPCYTLRIELGLI